jgi:hypothetical protein
VAKDAAGRGRRGRTGSRKKNGVAATRCSRSAKDGEAGELNLLFVKKIAGPRRARGAAGLLPPVLRGWRSRSA